jgi:hypothetical protein
MGYGTMWVERHVEGCEMNSPTFEISLYLRQVTRGDARLQGESMG